VLELYARAWLHSLEQLREEDGDGLGKHSPLGSWHVLSVIHKPSNAAALMKGDFNPRVQALCLLIEYLDLPVWVQ
jgi:hypothetical protein